MRARAMLWMMMGATIMPMAMFVVAACTGTREAYKEATDLYEYAFVMTEHYAALVKEAADLKEKPGTSPDVIKAMQDADKVAKPAVLKLSEAAEAFRATRDAKTEAELQSAIDNAVKLIADMVRAVQRARVSAQIIPENEERRVAWIRSTMPSLA